jgi:hypothetical protein
MIEIMSQFVSVGPECHNELDELFSSITSVGGGLRGTCFKVMSDIAEIPLLIGMPKVREVLDTLDISVPTLVGFAILAMEPGEKKFLFHPHQDLRGHTSLRSVILWTPLSDGKKIGGMGIYKGSHKFGPIKHGVAEDGHLEVPENIREEFEKVTFDDMTIGDVLFFSPYSVHWSLLNKGTKIRWTAVMVIDDAAKAPHLRDDRSPFVVSEFIDDRSNEERINEKLGAHSN